MANSVFNLSNLNGTNGFVINGINAYEFSGSSVSSAGDINGDGIADLIIRSSDIEGPNGGLSEQGYVVFGSKSGFGAQFNVSTLNGTNGFAINTISSNEYNLLGFSVSSAGDINSTGNDTLVGGAGNDVLTGGAGADRFLYNTSAAFNGAAIGVDTISDFNSSEADKIVLDKTTFSAIASVAGNGFSKKSDFQVTNLGQASTAKIVYNPVSGQLFYNENGSAPGFGSGGLFATLTGAPNLTASDFIIQA
ncbi:MAG: calcium-binding protein [Nostoc sp.]